MRRLHPRRSPRIAGAIGFALALLLSTTVGAQEPAPDATSMARYIPKDNVLLYIEYRGLDSQAQAWKKSTAYKILNDTPAGSMLEDVATQLLEKFARKAQANPRQWASNAMAIFKHMARAGFVYAAIPDPADPNDIVLALVMRDAFKDKAIRPVMAAYLQSLNAPDTKARSVVRAGHKVITGRGHAEKDFTWWVDDSRKEDIILVTDQAEKADALLDALDGKRSSMADHPRRAELLKPEDRFLPTGLAFIAPGITIAQAGEAGKRFERDHGYLGLGNINAVDLRWGFQDEALMTVARITTSGLRRGLLAFLDTSTFDKAKLPQIPPDVAGFSVASFDIAGSLDRLRGEAKPLTPDADAMIDKLVANVKEKTKLRLKEDLLAHLGPRVAWYTLPSKPAAKGPAGLAGMLGAGMEIPRFALVCDVDDPSTFGKVLDQAMVTANRELKAVGKPPAEAPAKGARSKAAGGPSLEFQPVGGEGEGKGYVLNVPRELAGTIPPTLRPSIRVGPKQVVIATSPEVARLVLDSKANWTPPSNLGAAYRALPANLKALNVTDPRETLPDLLAAFPAKVQQLAAAAPMFRTPSPPGGPPPLVLNVDAAKLPSADSIKALLFPSLFTVEATADEIRIVSRDAFPSVGDPSSTVVQLSLILPAIQALRAGRAAPPPGTVPPASAPPAGTPPGTAPSRPRPAAATSPS